MLIVVTSAAAVVVPRGLRFETGTGRLRVTVIAATVLETSAVVGYRVFCYVFSLRSLLLADLPRGSRGRR